MKRILTIVLALTCLLGLLGCSNQGAGQIRYYQTATEEHATPEVSKTVNLSVKQVKALKKIIDGVDSWHDDYGVNRLAFYFDGEFSFRNEEFIYYFSYERNLIYYDHYFAEISAEQMNYIKSLCD